MRTTLMYNPISGSGRGLALAEAFEAALRGVGHEVRRAPTHGPDGRLAEPLSAAALREAGTEVLVAVGGDGTVHRAAPLAAASGAGLYQVPAGTENLFARGYGMTRDPAGLVRAIARGRFVPMDLGVCAGAPFVVMASVGPDAGVIHRLQAMRRGPIRQWTYLRPIVQEIVSPRLPLVTVRVDGRVWLERARGLVVAGNSPHYAWRLNPARAALMDDGKVDVVFLPCDTIVDTFVWGARLMVAGEGPVAGAPWARGETVEIVPHDGDAMVEMDGEPGLTGEASRDLGRIVIGVQKHAFRVLDGR